jgi:hypothetical protein
LVAPPQPGKVFVRNHDRAQFTRAFSARTRDRRAAATPDIGIATLPR